MFWDYQPLIMVIRPQNMPQTSNSLLSPTKSMVAMGNAYPLRVPPPRTPPHTPSMYPLHVPPPRPPSAYPLCVPLRVPLRVPPLHTPSAYPLHVPEWIWLVNVPTTANQITGIEKANYHKILIFFPTTSLKSLHAARIDQLADSNEPAKRRMTSGALEVGIVNNGRSDDLERTNKCALIHTRSLFILQACSYFLSNGNKEQTQITSSIPILCINVNITIDTILKFDAKIDANVNIDALCERTCTVKMKYIGFIFLLFQWMK